MSHSTTRTVASAGGTNKAARFPNGGWGRDAPTTNGDRRDAPTTNGGRRDAPTTNGGRGAKACAGLTLLEILISSAMMSLLVIVAYSALQSMRSFTATNVTQVDLQESARHALERIAERLRNGARFTDTVSGLAYPRLISSSAVFPAGYSTVAAHAPKFPAKAPPGVLIGGGDPTLDSDDIVFRVPGDVDGDGLPTHINSSTQMAEIEFLPQEYSLVLAPGPDNQNQIEFRNSADPAGVEILARNVDRLQIQDYASDVSLTNRQLRVTIYMTRLIPRQGIISTSDPALASQMLTAAISSVIDLRNASSME